MELSWEMTVTLSALAAIFALGFLGGLQIRRFLVRTPVLAASDDLRAFKRVIAWNMYTALISIGLALVGGGFMVAAYAQDKVSWQAYVLVFVFAGLLCLVAVWTKHEETRLKTIPVTNELLARERDHLVKIWLTRALPKW